MRPGIFSLFQFAVVFTLLMLFMVLSLVTALWSSDIFHNYILWILFIIFRVCLCVDAKVDGRRRLRCCSNVFASTDMQRTERIYCSDKRHTHFSFDIMHEQRSIHSNWVRTIRCWKLHMRITTTISIECVCECHSVWIIVHNFFPPAQQLYLRNKFNEHFFNRLTWKWWGLWPDRMFKLID